eukprot:gnl/Dysnectes_brevis/7416_a12387_249.p1 GENE.gnl/Dysnectes_brevis/7416_a12387_249~~gnl/Dysnectes_brevis/7416_a12387_249.p1  ORF type:complete len:365 (-),score=116.18 gnl/Dysnectes_brevis/7416_a12387_249:93-1064(-)
MTHIQQIAANPRVLVLGSLGQIGTELIPHLRERYGVNNVVATDIRKPSGPLTSENGPFEYLDALDEKRMEQLVVKYDITHVIHNAAILSAVGERLPKLALQVNNGSTQTVFDVCLKHGLQVLFPSSIAAFGPTTDMSGPVPDITIQKPTTIYGLSKIWGEGLGEYYHLKQGLDFRCLRYPGIISSEALPGGGTTDIFCQAYYDAIDGEVCKSFLKHDTALPLLYMPDCLDATITLMECPEDRLSMRSYNVGGVSVNMDACAESIRKFVPDFEFVEEVDFREEIARSWPWALDDHIAKRDWQWTEKYGLDEMTKDMLDSLRAKK